MRVSRKPKRSFIRDIMEEVNIWNLSGGSGPMTKKVYHVVKTEHQKQKILEFIKAQNKRYVVIKALSTLEGKRVCIETRGHNMGRYTIRVGRKTKVYHRYVWNKYNPDNPVLPGEEIHHIDLNPLNCDISNLVKLEKEVHDRIHSKSVL